MGPQRTKDAHIVLFDSTTVLTQLDLQSYFKKQLHHCNLSSDTMWHAVVAIFKPFVYLWATLNVIDDFSLFMRLGRLGLATIPWPGKNIDSNGLCEVCDDVMGDLLKGSEGLSVVPLW